MADVTSLKSQLHNLKSAHGAGKVQPSQPASAEESSNLRRRPRSIGLPMDNIEPKGKSEGLDHKKSHQNEQAALREMIREEGTSLMDLSKTLISAEEYFEEERSGSEEEERVKDAANTTQIDEANDNNKAIVGNESGEGEHQVKKDEEIKSGADGNKEKKEEEERRKRKKSMLVKMSKVDQRRFGMEGKSLALFIKREREEIDKEKEALTPFTSEHSDNPPLPPPPPPLHATPEGGFIIGNQLSSSNVVVVVVLFLLKRFCSLRVLFGSCVTTTYSFPPPPCRG